MKKKLLLALASAAIIAGIVVIAVLGGNRNMEAHAADTHVHCECGGTVDAAVLAKGGHVCDATKEWTAVSTWTELVNTMNKATYAEPTDVYLYLSTPHERPSQLGMKIKRVRSAMQSATL